MRRPPYATAVRPVAPNNASLRRVSQSAGRLVATPAVRQRRCAIELRSAATTTRPRNARLEHTTSGVAASHWQPCPEPLQQARSGGLLGHEPRLARRDERVSRDRRAARRRARPHRRLSASEGTDPSLRPKTKGGGVSASGSACSKPNIHRRHGASTARARAALADAALTHQQRRGNSPASTVSASPAPQAPHAANHRQAERRNCGTAFFLGFFLKLWRSVAPARRSSAEPKARWGSRRPGGGCVTTIARKRGVIRTRDFRL